MNRIHIPIAAVAALILSGNVLAGSLQPAAGEGPFFQEQEQAVSTKTRAEVRSAAAGQMPASGTFSAASDADTQAGIPTRAEVRQATREAIEAGFRPATGTNNS